MRFFKQLELIGIGRNQLENASEEDLLRIEKKLLAEYKLNRSVSKDDISRILAILRTQLPDIQKIIVFYPQLYGLLSGSKPTHLDETKIHSEAEEKRIRELVSVQLRDEVLEYISESINRNRWQPLHILLYYREFLSYEILQAIVTGLEQKLNSAFAILEQKPMHWVLRRKLRFLTRKEFYSLLGHADAAYFKPYVLSLVGFMPENENYTAHTVFFDNMLWAAGHLDKFDQGLQWKISAVMHKYGGQNRFIWFGVGFIVLILGAFMWWVHNDVEKFKNTPKPRQNFWVDQRDGVLGEMAFEKEQINLDMLSFEEARQYTINDPSASRKAKTFSFSKYVNPFEAPFFKKRNWSLSSGERMLAIFNDTGQEMVVVANYKTSHQALHAIYVTPNDSIRINFDMCELRFYTGRQMKKFVTYRAYKYRDSMDYKFSRFGALDSVLLKTVLTMSDKNILRSKYQELTLSQPDASLYQLKWTGATNIYRSEKTGLESTAQPIDTLQRGHPILISTGKKIFPKNNYELIRVRESDFSASWDTLKKVVAPIRTCLLLYDQLKKAASRISGRRPTRTITWLPARRTTDPGSAAAW